jgi:chromosome segregation ATPase
MESDFKKMESNVNKLSKEFVKCNSEWEFMKEACDTERQRIEELDQNSNEVKENIQQKKKGNALGMV